MGVRISWLILDKNADFASLAAIASCAMILRFFDLVMMLLKITNITMTIMIVNIRMLFSEANVSVAFITEIQHQFSRIGATYAM